MSFPPFTWANSIADMSPRVSEIWMIYRVTNLDASENSLSIHEEKESCRNSSIPLVSEVAFCYLEELFESISAKECSR